MMNREWRIGDVGCFAHVCGHFVAPQWAPTTTGQPRRLMLLSLGENHLSTRQVIDAAHSDLARRSL